MRQDGNSKAQFSNKKFKLQKLHAESQNYGSFIDLSAKDFLIGYLTAAYEDDNQATKFALQEAKVSVEQDKEDNPYYGAIADYGYIRITRTQQEVESIILTISDYLNDIIEMEWV